ncbi:hypothetical protein DPMN_006668 [Dreissena polymorpha]|uniref:Uncharacterized protein n=1 Tax=Dreissena polymorpha TaxID=45954 RepID=A0A9D4MVS6_DREPO|nr:hypothetical protein DPMN_006668 [Dreissena polymorpha]
MDDDDDNVFTTSIIDRYAARPSQLHSMCLAQFTINYSPCKTSSDADHSKEKETTIHLEKNLGSMKKNSKQSCLRYHHYSVLKEPE